MPIYWCLLSHFVILFNSWRFCLIFSVFLFICVRLSFSLSICLPLCLSVCHSLWKRANARKVSFETLYGGQFTLPTQLIVLTYPVSVCLPAYLAVCLPVCLPVCLFIYLLVCLPGCVSVSVCVYLSVFCLSFTHIVYRRKLKWWFQDWKKRHRWREKNVSEPRRTESSKCLELTSSWPKPDFIWGLVKKAKMYTVVDDRRVESPCCISMKLDWKYS